MQNLILISAGAALAGLVVGWISATLSARRKYREQAEEVRGEVMRLRALAEEKLSGDDPNLDELIGNFQSAATSAYDAIKAMEGQVEITKAKSEGGRQVIASSAQIIRMIDEQAGLDDEPAAAPEKKKSPRLTAKKKA